MSRLGNQVRQKRQAIDQMIPQVGELKVKVEALSRDVENTMRLLAPRVDTHNERLEIIEEHLGGLSPDHQNKFVSVMSILGDEETLERLAKLLKVNDRPDSKNGAGENTMHLESDSRILEESKEVSNEYFPQEPDQFDEMMRKTANEIPSVIRTAAAMAQKEQQNMDIY